MFAVIQGLVGKLGLRDARDTEPSARPQHYPDRPD